MVAQNWARGAGTAGKTGRIWRGAFLNLIEYVFIRTSFGVCKWEKEAIGRKPDPIRKVGKGRKASRAGARYLTKVTQAGSIEA